MKCCRCAFDNPSGTRFCGRCAAPLPAEGVPAVPTETLIAPIRELTTGTTFACRRDATHSELADAQKRLAAL
jgi:hypothetical protein